MQGFFDWSGRNNPFGYRRSESLRDGLFTTTGAAAPSATAAATACWRIVWRSRSRGWARRRWRIGGRWLGCGFGNGISPRRRSFRRIHLWLGDFGSGLFGVEISWLQRGRRSPFRLGSLFFAALQALAHPFAHARLVTQMRRREQCELLSANQRRQWKPSFWVLRFRGLEV